MKAVKMSASTSKRNKKVHGVEEEEPISDDDFTFVGCVESTINSVNKTNEWYETLTIQNKSVQFQLDTGAKCNTISTKVYKSLENVPKLKKSDTPLKSYSGHPIVVLGTVVLQVTCKSETYNIKPKVLCSGCEGFTSFECRNLQRT